MICKCCGNYEAVNDDIGYCVFCIEDAEGIS